MVLVIYCVTVCANLLIIILVSYSKTLRTPMYYFLIQLSIADIVLTTDITPTMLKMLLYERTFICFSGCLTQLYFFAASETFECLLLMVMSYDRYLAICSPLHYVTIMNQELSIKLVMASWLLSCCMTLVIILGICWLEFCGPNTIDHFLCDLAPLLDLSCSDVSAVKMQSTLLCIIVIILPFIIIVVSYTYIISAILKISSSSGRLKSFSTCSSHLTVVSIFYGTLMVMYVLPNKEQSHLVNKVLAVFYTVLTPFLNPLIYSLRNREIKAAFRNAISFLSV
ncbi:olfactory receptor 1M1-like [Gastrophryne carolinensis]